MKAKKEFIGFEEIHITKRDDGEGFSLKAKGFWNGEPSVIEIPKLQQPNMNINKSYKHDYLFGNVYSNPHVDVRLSFDAELKFENEIYYTIKIDPKFYTLKKINELETELEAIKKKSQEDIQSISNQIDKLKELL